MYNTQSYMTVNFLYGEFAFSVIYLVHVYLDS